MDKYTIRQKRLSETLAAKDVDAFLVFKSHNIMYLTGFRGEDSFLLMTRQRSYIITDARYRDELRAKKRSFNVIIRTKNDTLFSLLNREIKKNKVKRLGFEPGNISYSAYRKMRRDLDVKQFKPCMRLIEGLRIIKTPSEIAKIQEAIKVAEASLNYVLKRLPTFKTEKQAADRLEYEMKLRGAETVSFPLIVAFGNKTAFPHAVSADTKIKRNNMLLFDIGARKDGYCSDLTRTFFLGKMSARFKQTFALVKEAQQLAINHIKAGALIGSADSAVRTFFKKHKVVKYFGHATGHGIGLEVHESPSLLYTNKDRFKKDMVVTVEPGLYFKGWGGVRIEDMVRVTANGCERLTTLPYNMQL